MLLTTPHILFKDKIIFHKYINLPVLPQGLQIMADQGFEHRLPVMVLPRANQPQIAEIMRRFGLLNMNIIDNYKSSICG